MLYSLLLLKKVQQVDTSTVILLKDFESIARSVKIYIFKILTYSFFVGCRKRYLLLVFLKKVQRIEISKILPVWRHYLNKAFLAFRRKINKQNWQKNEPSVTYENLERKSEDLVYNNVVSIGNCVYYSHQNTFFFIIVLVKHSLRICVVFRKSDFALKLTFVFQQI